MRSLCRTAGSAASCPRFRSISNVHVAPQYLIDASLVTASLILEPREHVGVDTDRDRRFSRRPGHQWLREDFLVEFGDVAVVEVVIAEPIDSRQVALDSARFRGHWPSSSK